MDDIVALAEKWQALAASAGETDDPMSGENVDVYRLNKCAAELLDLLGLIDTESSASRQHYIDTGRYVRLDQD